MVCGDIQRLGKSVSLLLHVCCTRTLHTISCSSWTLPGKITSPCLETSLTSCSPISSLSVSASRCLPSSGLPARYLVFLSSPMSASRATTAAYDGASGDRSLLVALQPLSYLSWYWLGRRRSWVASWAFSVLTQIRLACEQASCSSPSCSYTCWTSLSTSVST
jgi:hypothetical protein